MFESLFQIKFFMKLLMKKNFDFIIAVCYFVLNFPKYKIFFWHLDLPG